LIARPTAFQKADPIRREVGCWVLCYSMTSRPSRADLHTVLGILRWRLRMRWTRGRAVLRWTRGRAVLRWRLRMRWTRGRAVLRLLRWRTVLRWRWPVLPGRCTVLRRVLRRVVLRLTRERRLCRRNASCRLGMSEARRRRPGRGHLRTGVGNFRRRRRSEGAGRWKRHRIRRIHHHSASRTEHRLQSAHADRATSQAYGAPDRERKRRDPL